MRTCTWLTLLVLAIWGLASAPAAQKAEKLDTRLFKKDRTWLVKRTDRNANKGKETTYMQYKVKSVSAELAEVEQTQLDEKKKTVAKSAFTIKVKLEPDFYWFKIPEGAEIKDDESVTVEAGTFDCYVYTFAGATLYKSKKYPGLTVKGKSEVPEELIEFKTFKDDGVTADEKRAAPKPDFSLFSKKGRVWELTGKDSYKGEYVERYEVLQADDSSAKVQYTLRDKAGKAIGNQQDWTNSLTFDDAHKAWISPHDTGKYEKDETITVSAGSFDTVVYYRPISERWSATRWWYSKTLPGLTVKKEYDGGSCELTKLTLFKGEATTVKGPKAEADPVPAGPGVKPASGDDLEGGTVLANGKWVPDAPSDYRLFKLSGRKWSIQLSTKEEAGWLVLKPRHYEVKDVTASQSTLIERIEGSPEKYQPKPKTVEFQKDELLVHSRKSDQFTKVIAYPDEVIEVEAGVFDCHVYLCFERRKDGVLSILRWMSKKYPGLIVLRMDESSSGEQKSVSRQELVKFQRDPSDKGDDGKAQTPRAMPKFASIEQAAAQGEAPAQPDNTPADWSLFKKKGRKWTVKMSSKYFSNYTTYEILNVGKDFCEYKYSVADKDKKPTGQPSNTKLEFTEENGALYVKPLPSYKKVREEKLKAAGVEWECIVYEGSALAGQTQTCWMSKKYPGLYVKIITKQDNSETVSELTEFKD